MDVIGRADIIIIDTGSTHEGEVHYGDFQSPCNPLPTSSHYTGLTPRPKIIVIYFYRPPIS